MAVERHDSANMESAIGAADLSEKVFYLGTIDNTGKLAVCGNQGIVAGVITEGKAAGLYSTFSRGPKVKVIAGGSITAGERVESDGNGKAAAGTTAVFGVARTSASANEIVEVDFDLR
jgi:hypothetical protein